MRRVLKFLRWKSKEWVRRGETEAIALLTTCPYKLEGLHAYANRQAQVFRDLHNHFLAIWKGLSQPREPLVEPIYPVDLDPDAMELDGDDI
jgi:hypothetical protein